MRFVLSSMESFLMTCVRKDCVFSKGMGKNQNDVRA